MSQRTGLAACAALLALFAAVSFGAALTKAPTFDEPVQATAGWLRLHYGDFRLNFEDPPLWEDWAALPNGINALKPDFNAPDWTRMTEMPPLEWSWASRMLFDTPGVDGVAFVNRSRAMMLVVAVALGAMIALWSWRLAGPAAAVTSLAFFALDPNFLAHGSMVKNDISVSLVMLALAFLVWRLGQRFRWWTAVGLVLLCAAAANVKFSCVLLAPILLLLLTLRVLAPEPWPSLLRAGDSIATRIALVGVLLAGVAVVACVAVWADYGFRFSVTPDPKQHINTAWELDYIRTHQLGAQTHGQITPALVEAWKPDLLTSVFQWALAHRLMPEAWLWGFLFIYGASTWRTAYLLNSLSSTGWWYYFPFAMLVKTPLATIVAAASASAVGIWLFRRRLRGFAGWWTAACLAIPPAIYLLSAMRSHMNIGIRHVLPVYAFVYVGLGVVGAAAIRRWKRPAVLVTGGLAAAVALETAAALPNFLSFFNTAARAYRAPVSLLGDSNLDWGQDLPLLAEWQKSHPDLNLYLSYFGMVDPAYYGIRYHPLVANFILGPPPDGKPVQLPAVFAISASQLQQLAKATELYGPFRHRRPREVLGGTIYLFDVADEAALAGLPPVQ
jgi:hypothetical protein